MTSTFLPYGRQSLDDADIEAVVEVLRSEWLTTGPLVERFEAAIAETVDVVHAVAVCNGTAALHTALHALGIGPGDEVIVPPMTFAASANAIVYLGATPVFSDVDPQTLLLDPMAVEARLSSRTRAILGVDYAGQPCDYQALRTIADRNRLHLVADACHSLGGGEKGRSCGSLADLSTFSFHPVKPITTGEGGMVTTDDSDLARRMTMFRNHGITTDHRQRQANCCGAYEMVELGHNYRLSDIQSALGLSQLRHLADWTARRQQIAANYRAGLSGTGIEPLVERPDVVHSYHLFVVRVSKRDRVFEQMRERGIGVNLHYIPVHLHSYYRRQFKTKEGLCPIAEKAYAEILSLPIFPGMSDEDVQRVIHELKAVVNEMDES